MIVYFHRCSKLLSDQFTLKYVYVYAQEKSHPTTHQVPQQPFQLLPNKRVSSCLPRLQQKSLQHASLRLSINRIHTSRYLT
jgi:hypothetical protein